MALYTTPDLYILKLMEIASTRVLGLIDKVIYGLGVSCCQQYLKNNKSLIWTLQMLNKFLIKAKLNAKGLEMKMLIKYDTQSKKKKKTSTQAQ